MTAGVADFKRSKTDDARAAFPPFLANGKGNCADVDPDLFFLDGERKGARARKINSARAVCYGCPFIVACRDWAMDTGQTGVYGATTEEERAALKRWKVRHAVI